MFYRDLIACLLLLIACASALTITKLGKQRTLSSPKHQKQAFSIPVANKKRSSQQQREFINFIQKTHVNLKSGSFIQKSVHTTTLSQQSAVSVPITNYGNVEYIAKIALGSKDNTYNVMFDTGSTAAFFVDSTLCDQSDCVEHHQYDPSTSDTVTMTDIEKDLEIDSDDSYVEGILISEDVYLGDFKVSQYNMFMISEEDGLLENNFYDAVVGLGLTKGEMGDIQFISLFDAIKSQLPQPYFSFYLRRNDEADSYIMFGGFNQYHMTSDLTWHKVIDAKNWVLQLDNIYVGDNKIKFCETYKCGVLLDSGYSGISGPGVALIEIEGFMGDVTCDQISQYPSLWFEIEGHKYEQAYNEYLVAEDQNEEFEFYNFTEDIADCYLTFDSRDSVINETFIFHLGYSFFTKYYIVFDTNQNRIGLAPQKRG